MKPYPKSTRFCLAVTALFSTLLLVACGDDDNFTPVSRNRGYDYSLTSTKEFADYPCNEMRVGREAIVGREKDSYYCEFDSRDSVYIWVGDTDTLTAEGREFHRAESSSSVTPQNVTLSEVEGSSDSETSVSSSSYRSSSSYTSSSARSSSSSISLDWSLPKETYLNSEIKYDTIIDSRDGKVYKTVKIGEQTWMAENLNYDPGQGGSGDAKYEWSWCYDNEPRKCEVTGRLYTWAAAIDSVKMANDADDPQECGYGKSCTFWTPVQGICPNGWHLPSIREWSDLEDAVGLPGKNLKSQTGWDNDVDALNASGFSAIPAGWCRKDIFASDGFLAYFWGSGGYYNDEAGHIKLYSHSVNWESYYSEKDYGYSVRCIKNEEVVVPPGSSSSSNRSYSSSSSSNSSSSFFSLESKEQIFNPNISYGIMTDPRDGKKYRTVEVNDQIWLAENLNFSDSTIYPLLKGNNSCYDNNENDCELLGRLYSREAAMNDSTCTYRRSCNLGPDSIQGICPNGWHIPSVDEAQELIDFVGKDNAHDVMSAYGWRDDADGNNKYGLSFTAPGTWDDGKFDTDKGVHSYTWLYKNGSDSQDYLLIWGVSGHFFTTDFDDRKVHLSVRCIKD